MVNVSLEEAIKLASSKLDSVLEKNADIPRPFKAMVLGGYALRAICRNYGLNVERPTNDIDLFSPDARILISDEVALSPTGARILLTGNNDDPASFDGYCSKKDTGEEGGFYAELFDWISGMDRGKDLEKKIFDCLQDSKATKIKTNCRNVELYSPSPEIFIANKLFSYREHTSREKDLKDVGIILSILEDRDMPRLEQVEKLVKKYNLQAEYDKAKEYKFMPANQTKLPDYKKQN